MRKNWLANGHEIWNSLIVFTQIHTELAVDEAGMSEAGGRGAQILAPPLLLATHDFWLPRYNSSPLDFQTFRHPCQEKDHDDFATLITVRRPEDSNVINLGNSLHFKRLAERLCDKFDFRIVVARRTKNIWILNSFILQENIGLKSSNGFL